MPSKRYLILAAVGTAGTISLAGLAAAASSTIPKPPTLAQELAQRFNLKTGDVQSVIDQHHTEMQNYHEQTYEDRLNQAVTEGKLTSTQKDQILAKHKELAGFITSLQSQPASDRRKALAQKLTELHQWAKDNNIPAGYLGGVGRHFGQRFGDGSATTSTSSS